MSDGAQHAKSGAGGNHSIYSLIETCKMNATDPLSCLARKFTAIVSSHKQSQINEMLPWYHAAKV